MNLRVPCTPLITVDPYFSLWSPSDELNEKTTVHWTDSPNTLNGFVYIDGEEYRFMGDGEGKAMRQEYKDVSALVTDYLFSCDKIVLSLSFFTPLFTDDLYRLSRPVSYLRVKYDSGDGEKHDVKVKLCASEEFCIDRKGAEEVQTEAVTTPGGLNGAKMGSRAQKMLSRCGDDLRIEWGYFYLIADKAEISTEQADGMTFVTAEIALEEEKEQDVLFAYDDISSLVYFGENIEAYWKKKGISILEAADEAYGEADDILALCREKSEKLFDDAEAAGGEKYAELLCLAYRQVIAAHKLAVDGDGEIIFISKECFSNGCAATVDVTYPSSPMFLLYNTELLKGMLRPIFKFTRGDEWEFDFAPHDVGTYPILNGQKYGKGGKRYTYREAQMPVEECGNMLIMCANISMLDGNTDFADNYADILSDWVKYLVKYGADPENQLCTDDFAGHLAHNCNLSLKAIMGIAGYAKILSMKGEAEQAEKFMNIAREMAQSWTNRAANEDGSFRLAFDKPGTFSMKYNIIWDKLWGTGLFAPSVLYSEFSSNKKHINAYGMPLDNRKTYTKSDWLVWTAAMAPTKEEFEEFIAPLWKAYNLSPSRVPMTDWYDTVTSVVVGFRNRTVQGGLFIKLLEGIYPTKEEKQRDSGIL